MDIPHRPVTLHRMIGAVASLMMVAAIIATGPVPAIADSSWDPDACASQLAVLQEVQERIEQHNAQPNVFEPDQQAAYEAYNAEAKQLGIEQDTALAAAEACVDAIDALADEQPGSPPYRSPTQDKLDALTDEPAVVVLERQPFEEFQERCSDEQN